MVVDTSVLLSIFFNERHGPWSIDRLRENSGDLKMSTVNYAETLILVQDRQPNLISEIREAISESLIKLIPPTIEQAEMAARARLEYPLNLGDCFAYALAKTSGSVLLTLDRDFRSADVEVILPPR